MPDEFKELNLQIFSKKNIEFLSLLDPPNAFTNSSSGVSQMFQLQ